MMQNNISEKQIGIRPVYDLELNNIFPISGYLINNENNLIYVYKHFELLNDVLRIIHINSNIINYLDLANSFSARIYIKIANKLIPYNLFKLQLYKNSIYIRSDIYDTKENNDYYVLRIKNDDICAEEVNYENIKFVKRKKITLKGAMHDITLDAVVNYLKKTFDVNNDNDIILFDELLPRANETKNLDHYDITQMIIRSMPDIYIKPLKTFFEYKISKKIGPNQQIIMEALQFINNYLFHSSGYNINYVIRIKYDHFIIVPFEEVKKKIHYLIIPPIVNPNRINGIEKILKFAKEQNITIRYLDKITKGSNLPFFVCNINAS